METLSKGDVAFIPQGYGHSIENIGQERCRVLVAFNTGHYQAIDLSQWLSANQYCSARFLRTPFMWYL